MESPGSEDSSWIEVSHLVFPGFSNPPLRIMVQPALPESTTGIEPTANIPFLRDRRDCPSPLKMLRRHLSPTATVVDTADVPGNQDKLKDILNGRHLSKTPQTDDERLSPSTNIQYLAHQPARKSLAREALYPASRLGDPALYDLDSDEGWENIMNGRHLSRTPQTDGERWSPSTNIRYLAHQPARKSLAREALYPASRLGDLALYDLDSDEGWENILNGRHLSRTPRTDGERWSPSTNMQYLAHQPARKSLAREALYPASRLGDLALYDLDSDNGWEDILNGRHLSKTPQSDDERQSPSTNIRYLAHQPARKSLAREALYPASRLGDLALYDLDSDDGWENMEGDERLQPTTGIRHLLAIRNKELMAASVIDRGEAQSHADSIVPISTPVTPDGKDNGRQAVENKKLTLKHRITEQLRRCGAYLKRKVTLRKWILCGGHGKDETPCEGNDKDENPVVC